MSVNGAFKRGSGYSEITFYKSVKSPSRAVPHSEFQLAWKLWETELLAWRFQKLIFSYFSNILNDQ